jgi:hypothetical protein
MAGTIIADAVQAASTSQLNIKNGVALTPPTISDVNNVAIGTFCRAWVNFNGTGTVAIRASFNVTSITDNGTGDYTVNFTNAMPDVNYSPCVSSGFGSSAGSPSTSMTIFANSAGTVAPTTSSFRFYGLYSGSFLASDSAYYCVSVFR